MPLVMADTPKKEIKPVLMGRVAGVFGVRGWIKIHSHTRPEQAILEYSPWYLRQGDVWQPYIPDQGQEHGKGIIVHLKGVEDRDTAIQLVQTDIAIARAQLPDLPAGQYYWADLEGLRVETPEGRDLGIVDHLMETGANDVFVVEQDGGREILIPYIPEVVREIDLDRQLLVVDWDPDY